MMKRVLALTISVIMLLSTMAMAATFSDVTEKTHSWAMDAVSKMSEQKIITGYPDGTFKPDVNVTRMESLLMIARILGFNSVTAQDFMSNIYATYENDLEDITSKYKNELAFLLFRNVFTVDEIQLLQLDAQLSREEASYYMIKALGLEDKVKETSVVMNAYIDDAEIASVYRKYVYYARDIGIMQGIGKDNFAPKAGLTRAQIATLLYRVMDKVTSSILRGTIDSVDITTNTAKVFVVTKTYDINSTVEVKNKGKVIKPEGLYANLGVVVTMSEDQIVAVDGFFEEPVVENIISGEVKAVSAATGLQIYNQDTGLTDTYTLAERCKIVIAGKEGIITNIRVGDFVELQLDQYNKALSVELLPITRDLTDVVISDIVVGQTVTTVEVTDAEGEVAKYPVNPANLTVRKNGAKVEFNSLSIGDKLSRVSLKYNRIENIDAYSDIKSGEGRISEIHISNSSYIKVGAGSETVSYPFTKDTKIYLFGELKTIYDLKLDQYAKVTLDGSLVSKVEVSTQTTNANVIGTVEAVNQTAGIVTVRNTENGNSMSVFISTTKTKIFDESSTSLISKSIKDIRSGQKVMVSGGLNNGVFEATTVLILK